MSIRVIVRFVIKERNSAHYASKLRLYPHRSFREDKTSRSGVSDLAVRLYDGFERTASATASMKRFILPDEHAGESSLFIDAQQFGYPFRFARHLC